MSLVRGYGAGVVEVGDGVMVGVGVGDGTTTGQV